MENRPDTIIFDDPSYYFEFIRVLAKALEHGSDIGECLETAWRIRNTDPSVLPPARSWCNEWKAIADRIMKIGNDCKAKNHRVSARDAYLRACEYYRSADFYLHDTPKDPEILDLWEKMHAAFLSSMELTGVSFEEIEIPYEGTNLPGYFWKPEGDSGPAPTLIIHSGFDGSAEEVYLECVCDALRRGYHCLVFEGPGQGVVIRKQEIPFRYDWEKVITPVVDYAVTRPDVDREKIILMGLSMGGYFAPRAAAFEHRLAACIANGGVYDIFGNNARNAGLTRNGLLEFLQTRPDEYNRFVYEACAKSTQTHWGVTHGMWVFGVKTPAEFALAQEPCTLKDCAHLIRCPTLVLDVEGEQFFAGQADQLYDALTCEKTLIAFTAEEGARLHCQEGARLLSNQRIYDWVDETLARK
ncbi:alpha/beta fold hydrolase [uncultured Methanoregula sp.]|uniref:alpha/beta hydrolase family protein n=1 Tax=uncultured Methanoregula sp. TaxID=1005933 RepID=UPI002AAB0E2F|nr:alpha/beta fold hydrolase [uncultured Methanoregula sp.]